MKKRFIAFVLSMTCLSCSLGPAAAVEPDIETLHIYFADCVVRIGKTPVDFWDSNGKSRRPLAYNGTVYIPLRSAAKWLGADVEWEQEVMTVHLTSGAEPMALTSASASGPLSEEEQAQLIIDRDEGMDVQLRRDITVTLDGKVQHFANVLGEPVYPLLFRECVYLPVRSIGELCGKEVIWVPQTRNSEYAHYTANGVYLYDRPTEEQLLAGQQYYDTASKQIEELYGKIEALTDENDLGKEGLTAAVQEIMDLGLSIVNDPSYPSAEIFQVGANAVRGNVNTFLYDAIYPYTDPDKLLQPDWAALDWTVHRDHLVSVRHSTHQDSIDFSLEWCRLILEAVEQNEQH